jgi:hypothetical protein
MAHQDVSPISGAFGQFEQSWVFSHDDSVSCIVMRMHPAERQLKWQKRPRVSSGPSHGHWVTFSRRTGMGCELASVNAGPESRGECSIRPIGFENIGDGPAAAYLDIARILGRRKFGSGRPFARTEFQRASGCGRVAAMPRARSSGFAKRSSRIRGTLPCRSLALAGSPRGGVCRGHFFGQCRSMRPGVVRPPRNLRQGMRFNSVGLPRCHCADPRGRRVPRRTRVQVPCARMNGRHPASGSPPLIPLPFP